MNYIRKLTESVETDGLEESTVVSCLEIRNFTLVDILVGRH
jgi:hypothetical protein